MSETQVQANNKAVEFKRKRIPKGARKMQARGLISEKQIAKMKETPGE